MIVRSRFSFILNTTGGEVVPSLRRAVFRSRDHRPHRSVRLNYSASLGFPVILITPSACLTIKDRQCGHFRIPPPSVTGPWAWSTTPCLSILCGVDLCPPAKPCDRLRPGKATAATITLHQGCIGARALRRERQSMHKRGYNQFML